MSFLLTRTCVPCEAVAGVMTTLAAPKIDCSTRPLSDSMKVNDSVASNSDWTIFTMSPPKLRFLSFLRASFSTKPSSPMLPKSTHAEKAGAVRSVEAVTAGTTVDRSVPTGATRSPPPTTGSAEKMSELFCAIVAQPLSGPGTGESANRHVGRELPAPGFTWRRELRRLANYLDVLDP